MKRLALFDIDCTLTKGPRDESKAYSKALEVVYGVSTSIDIIDHHGMTDIETLVETLKEYGLESKDINPKLDDLKKALTNYALKRINNGKVAVLPGVKDLLNILQRKKVVLGIVTGNLEIKAMAKLERAGLSNFFGFGGFGSDDMNRENLVQIAIERSNNFGFKNGQIFHFGDTQKDIIAGNKHGATTVGVATGKFSVQDLKDIEADFAFEDLSNTERILQIFGF